MTKAYYKRSDPLDVRFWGNVSKGQPDECWVWVGAKNSCGYGQLSYKGKHYWAHRLSYELHHQCSVISRPDERVCICHHCDNRACVNPAHLFLDNQSANMKDALNKGKLSPWVYAKIEQGKTTKRERDAYNTRREGRRIEGGVDAVLDQRGKVRDRMGRYSDGQTAYKQTERDESGRFKVEGKSHAPRKRNQRGHFIKKGAK